MAHSYYLVSGRPQAVMFHVNVGTANALMGLINAARDNVPIFFHLWPHADRLVMAAVGDGSYMFANPIACH